MKKIFSNVFSRQKVNIYWTVIIVGILIIAFLLGGCSRVIFYPYGPLWSPDGSKIAFTSQTKNESYNIFIMNSDGSNKINLTNNTGNDYHLA